MRSLARRPRVWVSGLALALGLGLLTWGVLDQGTYRPATPTLTDTTSSGDPAAQPAPLPGPAGQALAGLIDAVVDDDPAAAAALAADDDPALADQLAAVVDNARALGLTAVSARYVDRSGPVAADGAWTAAVTLTWQVAGIDERPARSEVAVRFVPRADDDTGADPPQVAIAGLGDASGRTPLWWATPLTVARSGPVLVAVAGSGGVAATQARRWLRRVEAGTRVVRRVLPDWDGRAVLEVAGSPAQVDRALDVADGTYAHVAAVTAPAGAERSAGAPVHVVVNPAVAAGMRARGLQVVTSHELAHLATDATRGALPTWLSEGFADYVALRDVALPRSVTAARARGLVRASGVPDQLPDDAGLAPDAPDVAAGYELSWLVCTVLAERAGEQALLRVYDAVQAGGDLDVALREHAGLERAELLGAWQDELRVLGR